MSPLFRCSALSRRGMAGGLLGAAALALVAFAPIAPVGAESVGGTITVIAHVCESPADELLTCPAMHPGALTLVHEDGVELLTMDESFQQGNTVEWGETTPVQTGIYYLETDYLTVPDGYKFWDFVAIYGVVSGSDLGWYVSTSADAPDVSFAAIYVPIDVDTDGDGASDDVEIAYGSDPLDPNSWPEGVQAGPDPVDTDGDGASDEVEILLGSDPNDPNSWPEGVQAGPEDTDSDGDGAGDGIEIQNGTDPYDPNSWPQGTPAGPEADSDGDGAYDDIETAYGSDPNDPNDFPKIQAGSEPVEEVAAGGEYVITTLPNTGAGTADAESAVDLSLMALFGGGIAAITGAAVALRRRTL